MPNLEKYNHATDIASIDEDVDEEKLEKINNILQGMAGETVGLERLDDGWGADKVDTLMKKTGSTSSDVCPNDAEKGDIWSDPSGELLWRKKRDFDDPWKFVVAYGFASRIRFPDDKNNVEFCKSSDAKRADTRDMICKNCPDLPGPNNRDSPCNNVRNFIVVPLDLTGIYQLRLSSSGFREGDTIIDSLQKARRSEEKVFGLTTKKKSSDTHEWVGFSVKIPNTDEPPKEVQAFAQFVREQYKAAYEQKLAERDAEFEGTNKAVDDAMGVAADELGDPDEDSSSGGVQDTM